MSLYSRWVSQYNPKHIRQDWTALSFLPVQCSCGIPHIQVQQDIEHNFLPRVKHIVYQTLLSKATDICQPSITVPRRVKCLAQRHNLLSAQNSVLQSCMTTISFYMKTCARHVKIWNQYYIKRLLADIVKYAVIKVYHVLGPHHACKTLYQKPIWTGFYLIQ